MDREHFVQQFGNKVNVCINEYLVKVSMVYKDCEYDEDCLDIVEFQLMQN